MRVSQYYKLKRTQAELDFVDVDVAGDTPLFIDPQAIRQLPDDWGHECVRYMQDFFSEVLDAIRKSDNARARGLLEGLREPNETHLGFSRGRSQGRALGPQSAWDVWDALAQSQAAQSGLLVDLEDTILLVYGIGPDIVSDITTNLIRLPLIKYTQSTCDRYGIPTADQVWSGHLWNPDKKRWDQGGYVRLPAPKGVRLLLTPKAIVRRKMEYDAHEYYGDFIIPFLEQEEIRGGTSLVRTLKSRAVKWVAKKDLAKKYGADKSAIVRITLDHPQLLGQYKGRKATAPQRRPLGHVALAAATGSALPDLDRLLNDVVSVPTGTSHATDYHRAVERLLSALFSTSLIMPKIEMPLHEGRKRIDITYVNAAQNDFFAWVKANYPAGHVFVECKNYKGDPKNPELDQLAGRFSPSRGKFGLLACRTMADKELFLKRCRDNARDDRGWIIPLDDDDLRTLTAARKDGNEQLIYQLFMDRFEFLLDLA
jgi:hypothetical protein